jgi:hypothetical protein
MFLMCPVTTHDGVSAKHVGRAAPLEMKRRRRQRRPGSNWCGRGRARRRRELDACTRDALGSGEDAEPEGIPVAASSITVGSPRCYQPA